MMLLTQHYSFSLLLSPCLTFCAGLQPMVSMFQSCLLIDTKQTWSSGLLWLLYLSILLLILLCLLQHLWKSTWKPDTEHGTSQNNSNKNCYLQSTSVFGQKFQARWHSLCLTECFPEGKCSHSLRPCCLTYGFFSWFTVNSPSSHPYEDWPWASGC